MFDEVMRIIAPFSSQKHREIAAINRLELEAGEWEGKEEVATIFVKVQLQLFTWSQLYDHVNGICRIRYLIIPYLNETTRAHQRESKLSSRFHSTSYNYTSSGRPSRKVHWLAQQFEIVHAIKKLEDFGLIVAKSLL
uniref:Uncharacterized protein n=1 Tax=Onchocerca volvulus TaxID=6282 RepID=A0A8R1TUJ7_ONCVO